MQKTEARTRIVACGMLFWVCVGEAAQTRAPLDETNCAACLVTRFREFWPLLVPRSNDETGRLIISMA